MYALGVFIHAIEGHHPVFFDPRFLHRFLPSTPRYIDHWPEEMQANETFTHQAPMSALSDLL